MDFTPTEEQRAAQELAAQIFGDLSTHERLSPKLSAPLEQGGRPSLMGTDGELWKAICAAGLIAAVEEIGLLGLVLLLEEQGRTTAQVPFAATCVYGLLAIAAHGNGEQRARLLPAIGDGTTVVTGAFPATGSIRSDASGAVSGTAPLVPWLRDATHVLVADADRALWLVPTADPAVTVEPVETTAPWSAGRLTLNGAPGECIGGDAAGGAYEHVLATSRTAFAGLQAGVCAGSLALAVEHTSTREQFGRPLSTNQGVLLRAADAYMDTEAIRVTAYEAAWRRDEGLPFATHALTAAWWASEAGQRVVHTGQHLHGGTGADLDHPVHRHFLWGRQLDAYLGSGSEVLAELGELIVGADRADQEDRVERVGQEEGPV
ncbi:acyl-CoA dehydrogenase family protein [Streptomyces spiramyceticus]|uniref:acyl-CoA dehydrogenase family protein n=1 Tax=Streptomyces spiramyceticus TaxID=299717 RepID=UPI00237B13CD|nr:acyl-CoA dehydrogenase family protein [Streptomyces spiramyceticus]